MGDIARTPLTGPCRATAAGVPVVAVSAALAARALPSRRSRRDGYGVPVGAVAVGGGGRGEWPGWWWVELPVEWGMLARCWGDAMALSTCPLRWPLRIRNCRWRGVGSPQWLRFQTGGAAALVID
ncbi:hypothetical protein [Micromonospora sp. WMMD1082]|uniref:hypothetical protein n=1 Tax=Micromonospora sp. WMMD1082 TaxID=3016104 RepID=UPI0024165081|nr:hypothetical protein [Micromonospora sp. WMMD1082]MDG4795086.1 hypothetical protein [Micromonospora sp. WMMD1082]